MNRQRLTLLLVIIVSASIAIAIESAEGSKPSNWYDARDFYKMYNAQEKFFTKYFDEDEDEEDYYYEDRHGDYKYSDDFKLVVRVAVDDTEINKEISVRAGSESDYITEKDLRDGRETITMYLEDVDNSEEVCIESSEFAECEIFSTRKGSAAVSFVVRD